MSCRELVQRDGATGRSFHRDLRPSVAVNPTYNCSYRLRLLFEAGHRHFVPTVRPATVSAPPYDRSALWELMPVADTSLKGEMSAMICSTNSTSPHRRVCLRAIAGSLLLILGAACSNGVGPSSTTNPADAPATTPNDSAATNPADDPETTPSDSAAPPVDSTHGSTGSALYPGIVFGVAEMPKAYFSTVYNGTAPGGALDPTNMLSLLSTARAKGARVVIKLCMGRDMFVKNADGTFSFTKWRALVDRYKTINFTSYITDGTITGHFLIDEPSRPERWGGKVISQSQIEQMAAYSKKLWPSMPTLVRVVPSWLAQAPITYTYLDAGWFQYAARFGDPAKALAAEVAAAKSKGLGLMASMNVLDGGNGSSGIPGWSTGKWAMSATEVRNYGTELLSQSYICGFHTWMWDVKYYGRADITSATAALSAMAKVHTKTSCRQ
jgi:hypothetical protein